MGPPNVNQGGVQPAGENVVIGKAVEVSSFVTDQL